MNAHSKIGHNSGHATPMEACAADFDDIISEAQNWADGDLVTTEAQMQSVDTIIKGLKTYGTALNKAGKEHTEPFHVAWKASVADVKVYTEDRDRMQKTLVSAVGPFKAKLAAQKEAERKAAWEAARQAEREAEALAAKANAASLEDARAADAARQAAMDAKKAASETQKDTVKGMRTVKHHEITDFSAMLRWMNKHDRPALETFCKEYARKCSGNGLSIDGVREWTTKEAF